MQVPSSRKTEQQVVPNKLQAPLPVFRQSSEHSVEESIDDIEVVQVYIKTKANKCDVGSSYTCNGLRMGIIFGRLSNLYSHQKCFKFCI